MYPELILLATLLLLVGLIFLVSILIGKVAAKLTGRPQRSKAWSWRIFCLWISLTTYIRVQNRLMLLETVGMTLAYAAVILGAVLFVYWVFFRWDKSRLVGPSDFVKHRFPLIACFLVFPFLTFGLGIWMLPLTSFDQVFSYEFTMGVWIIFVMNALVAVPVVWGFDGKKRWAKKMARFLSFWCAGVSLPGLSLAFYTWWATQTNANVGSSEPKPSALPITH